MHWLTGIFLIYIIATVGVTLWMYAPYIVKRVEAFQTKMDLAEQLKADRFQRESADFQGAPADWDHVQKNKSEYTMPVWTDVKALTGDYWKGPVMPSELITSWPDGCPEVDYLYPGRPGDIPFVNPLYTMPLYKKM